MSAAAAAAASMGTLCSLVAAADVDGEHHRRSSFQHHTLLHSFRLSAFICLSMPCFPTAAEAELQAAVDVLRKQYSEVGDRLEAEQNVVAQIK